MARPGADRTVDYAKEKFEDAGPFGVVYDGVCGPLVERGIGSLKPGGRYVGLVRMADAQSYREIGLPGHVCGRGGRRSAPMLSRPASGEPNSTGANRARA